jgi:hypothetical protein
MKKLLHIGNTPVFDGQSTTVSELTAFLDEQRRLPELASNFKFHRGYLHAQGNNLASQLMYGIANKLSIVDPTIKFVLPMHLVSLAKGLIHRYRAKQSGAAAKLRAAYNALANVIDDDHAATFLEANGRAGWNDDKNKNLTWFRLAFYEEEAPAISHKALYTMTAPDPARDFRFYADLAYCLVIFTGKGTPPARPPTWIDLDAYRGPPALACGATQEDRWFKVGQYVPDEQAVRWMQFDTKAHYMRITGRVPGYEDSYWHLSGWERFKEGAKMAGEAVGKLAIKAGPVIVKSAFGGSSGMTTGSPSGVPSYWKEQSLMDGGAGDSTAGPATYARAMWHGHTTDFNRKSIVPPGFCFVKFNARLNLAVVRTDVV